MFFESSSQVQLIQNGDIILPALLWDMFGNEMTMAINKIRVVFSENLHLSLKNDSKQFKTARMSLIV